MNVRVVRKEGGRTERNSLPEDAEIVARSVDAVRIKLR